MIVAPISSKVQKNKIPTHVLIESDQLERKSIVLLEQIRTIDKKRIFDKVGSVSPEKMKLINEAIKTSLDIK